MKVLVCGGRNFGDTDLVYSVLDSVNEVQGIGEVIEGAAQGADRIASHWAHNRGITNRKFYADWEKHGKAAGPIRNQQMLDEGKPDLVIAFTGGRGTEDMCARAERGGVEVRRVDITDTTGNPLTPISAG